MEVEMQPSVWQCHGGVGLDVPVEPVSRYAGVVLVVGGRVEGQPVRLRSNHNYSGAPHAQHNVSAVKTTTASTGTRRRASIHDRCEGRSNIQTSVVAPGAVKLCMQNWLESTIDRRDRLYATTNVSGRW